MGGMKKKGYAKGGLKMVKNKKGDKVPFYAADGKGKMDKGGMMSKKKGYAKGGAMMPKKKAYAKGGKVAMYNEGGMVRNTGKMNTGVKTVADTYNKGK